MRPEGGAAASHEDPKQQGGECGLLWTDGGTYLLATWTSAPFSYLQDHRCVAALVWALPVRAKAGVLHWAAQPHSARLQPTAPGRGWGVRQVPRASAVPGALHSRKAGPSPVGRGALSSHLPPSRSSVSSQSHHVPPCGSGRPGRWGGGTVRGTATLAPR